MVAPVAPPEKAPLAGREANGRFTTGNPGGGRPALPVSFREKGPRFLEKISAIAETEGHEHQLKALIWCAERIYGKAPAEVADDGEERAKAALVAFVEAMKLKPSSNDPEGGGAPAAP